MRFTSLFFLVLAASCARASTTDEGGSQFRGEAKLLDGFAFSTGAQPKTGPASVSLSVSGGGALRVEASGAAAGATLAGTPGSGRVSIDAHLKIDGTLKIDSPIKKSEGDIPGLKDLDIPIVGSATFDPFLLDGATADAVAEIPETKLPDVPLGSVPGKLRLTIVAGSRLTSKYSGTCLTVASGTATYAGRAVTSGTLVLKGTIVLELPAPLNKEIPLPEIKVPIPAATSEIVFNTVAFEGAPDSESGSCAAPGADAGGDGPLVDSRMEADSGTDTSTTDTSATDSSATDTSATDTSTPDTKPACSDGDDAVEAKAIVLPKVTDCDKSGSMVLGVLGTPTDVDVYRVDGEDTVGCTVNAFAEVVSGPARLCVRPVCVTGTMDFAGCTEGFRAGDACCGTKAEPKFNCVGTAKDDARVFISVRSSSPTASCSNYTIRYHY